VDGTLPDDGETPPGTGEPLPAPGLTPHPTAAVIPARA